MEVDEAMESEIASQVCPHIQAVLEDDDVRIAILDQYKATVAWSFHRTQALTNTAKRRKVRDFDLEQF
jgi:hypothetical protein